MGFTLSVDPFSGPKALAEVGLGVGPPAVSIGLGVVTDPLRSGVGTPVTSAPAPC